MQRIVCFFFLMLITVLGAGLVWAQDQPESTPAPIPPPTPETPAIIEPEAAPEEPAVPAREEKSKFTLNGYIQNQSGVFINSNYHNEVDAEGFPTDHGDLWGKPSMFRNTLFLEADWQPSDPVRVHAIFRGVRSTSLTADRFAQVPYMVAATSYDYNKADEKKKREEVWKNFYNETDLREIYVDINATNWLNFRLGRQQVAWGETANARLLDCINPINPSWHLSLFEPYEEQRVPLWIAKSLVDIPQINANFEVVFVPLIDKPEDTVTPPYTFFGAWGLPIAPKNDFPSPLHIVKKTQLFPENDLEDARWGARWKEVLGPVTYTLVYYHGHILLPPIPKYAENTITTNAQGLHDAEVFLEYPRQDTYGASVELAIPSPVSVILKSEATYLPGLTYPVSSFLPPGTAPDGGKGWYASPDDPNKIRADFYSVQRDTWNYAIVLQRPNQIRWLNPTGSIITQFQFIQSIVPEGPYIDEELANGQKKENKQWYIVSVPGYDSSQVPMYSTTYAAAVLTSYARGLISPMLLGVYDASLKAWIASASMDFTIGDHLRMKLAYNQIEGDDPYKGFGLYRDRDEVNFRIRYQF